MNATKQNAFGQNAIQERLILEAANEYAIFTTDLQRRVTSWNTGAENRFGYDAGSGRAPTGRRVLWVN